MKKYIIDKLPGDIIGKIVLSDFLSPPPDDTNEVIIGVTVIMDQVFRQDDVKILEFLDHVSTIYMVGVIFVMKMQAFFNRECHIPIIITFEYLKSLNSPVAVFQPTKS